MVINITKDGRPIDGRELTVNGNETLFKVLEEIERRNNERTEPRSREVACV